MSENQHLHQLWAACSQDLQRQLHHEGSAKTTSVNQLFDAIKRLAVNRRNNLVNIVEFQHMGQHKDETIMAFTTRLNGQADVCDMYTPCHDCNKNVTYKEDMLMYQFLCGLNDTNIQEKIMESAANTENQKITMTKAMKIAEAYELGKTSQQLVNNGGELSRISQHQLNKRSSRQNTHGNKPSDSKDTKKSEVKCGNCGKAGHSSKLNDRRENCKAFDKTCGKCNLNGHYTNMCRGGPKASRDKSKPNDKIKSKVSEVKETTEATEETADLGQLTGEWFLLNGLQGTSQKGVLYKVQDEFLSVVHQENKCSQKGSLEVLSKKDIEKMRHHMMDDFGRWTPSNIQPHGKLQLQVAVSQSATKQLQLPQIKNTTSTQVSALADTGAQMCVADWRVSKNMGLKKLDLLLPALSVSVADNSRINWSTFLVHNSKVRTQVRTAGILRC